MHQLKTKVPSFTLTEMLVVLVLSSIIVTIIYFSYYTISKYQINLTNKYSNLNDMSTMYFLLKKDFDRSSKIISVDEFNVQCEIPKIDSDVYYDFSSSYIVRRQAARVDTFKVTIDKPVFSWQGKVVDKPDAQIDEIKVDFIDMPQYSTLVVYKQYDAASLIQNTKADTLRERN